MKRSTVVFALAIGSVIALMYSAANADEKASMKHEAVSRAYLHNYNLPSSGVALEGYCPVAYFAVNKPVRGKKEFSSDYNGVTYYLVNAKAKQAFEKDPEKFLPAYGGWCATGMALKDKFPVDPRNFKIVDGRLLLFLTNKNVDAQQVWNQGDQQEQLAKADAHWQSINK